MAEAIALIGFIASIATFIDIGVKLTIRLKEYESEATGLPESLANIANQLPLLTSITQGIKAACESGQISCDRAKDLAPVIEGCQRQLDTLGRLVSQLSLSKGDSRARRITKAFANIGKESKLREIRRSLETFKTVISAYFNYEASLGRSLHSDSTTEETKHFYEVPSLHVARFFGRQALLSKVKESLNIEGNGYPRRRVSVLLGMGGQGKTQLALEYCRTARDEGRFKTIFWLNASSPGTLSGSYDRIAAKILPSNLKSPLASPLISPSTSTVVSPVTSPNVGVKSAFIEESHSANQTLPKNDKETFERGIIDQWEHPWLIVLDNFDHPSAFKNIQDHLPQGDHGTLLFTSRHIDSTRIGNVIEVTGMTDDEGVDLLLHQSRCEKTEAISEVARAIVRSLGGLPLAIDQAGAYIYSRRLPLNEFPSHFAER